MDIWEEMEEDMKKKYKQTMKKDYKEPQSQYLTAEERLNNMANVEVFTAIYMFMKYSIKHFIKQIRTLNIRG